MSAKTTPQFIHLHVHSAYSLSEGALKTDQLVDLVQTHNMPAVAVTDTNNLFGGMGFALKAAQSGIQPTIGCQLDVVLHEKLRLRVNSQELAPQPIVLLVQNETGYQNLLKIVSNAHLSVEEGDPPHATMQLLQKYNEGLILLTGSLKSPVCQLLLKGQKEEAEEKLSALKHVFGNRLYVEIQRHGWREQDKIEPTLIDLAYKLDLPLVATNNCYFATQDMYLAHDALITNAQGTTVSNAKRWRLTDQHYFKSTEEMAELFKDLPEAIHNTVLIARRCGYMPQARDPILPPFPVEEGGTEEEELRIKSKEGLERRLETQVFTSTMDKKAKDAAAKPYRDRLNYELDVIVKMGFPGYFLIVSDFMRWAVRNGIPVGPGRGSGAGSVVAWSLEITGLDPLKWGLLFERFLNPERVSMPDFDIDFCQERRDDVIEYVKNKYGADKVAQIITFGKLQARAVLRDVGRVFEMPYGQVDRICKLVPNNPANPVTLGEAIESEEELQRQRDEDESVARLLDIGLKLEGLYRHASTHAAGVVIGDRPLDELIPLYRDPRSDMPVTQFDMKMVEKAGLVKFDFLGLKTLTVLSRAIALIKDAGVEIDLDAIPLDDASTYEMLARGETTGVFQLESAGMRDVLKKLEPDRFEDIIAVVALYRPGPMDNIPAFIERKQGREKVEYLHPKLEELLKETYGIMIYQEQVMEAAQRLAGYSLGGADLLRRAMGKKIKKEMDAQRETFIEGAASNDVGHKLAGKIFDQIAKFAGYGFNKSHAAAYAMVAYQTAYLKANHPVEFMAALMTLDMGNTDKLNIFRQELDRLQIPLMPPSINHSMVEFSVEKDGDTKAIRYALGALKGAGSSAMAALVQEREESGPYKGAEDFALRLDSKVLNKRQLEALCYAGAFDCLTPNRASVHACVETILSHAQRAAAERSSNQNNLFGGEGEVTSVNFDWPDMPDWPAMDKLKYEFDAIGFYLSAHPLDSYDTILNGLDITPSAAIASRVADGDLSRMKLAGVVTSIKERTSARGNKYAFATLSDATGVYEVTLFSDVLTVARDLLNSTEPLLLSVDPQKDEEAYRLTCQSVESIDKYFQKMASDIKLCLLSEQAVTNVANLLENQAVGRSKVFLKVFANGYVVDCELPKSYALPPMAMAELKAMQDVSVE